MRDLIAPKAPTFHFDAKIIVADDAIEVSSQISTCFGIVQNLDFELFIIQIHPSLRHNFLITFY